MSKWIAYCLKCGSTEFHIYVNDKDEKEYQCCSCDNVTPEIGWKKEESEE